MTTRKLCLSEFTLELLKHVGILLLILCAFWISPALPQAQAAQRGVAHLPLPANLSGTLDGTEYKIRVPANWNRTLLVYAHGSKSGLVQVAPPTFPESTLEEELLSLGYALAGSYYQDSEKEGPLRTLALTNFFKGAVGNPQRTIVWGVSLGAQTAVDLIETYPGIYDGGIAVALMGAGRPRTADLYLRYDLAYGAAFGWPSDWWGPIEDLRDDLYVNEATLLMPVFQWFNGENYGQWEFIRLVMKESTTAWWDADPSFIGLPGYAFAGWGATAYRSHWENLCGGPVSQNIGAHYTLTDEEKAYLSTLGVNADQLLAWMNAHTNIAASRSARNHLAQYGTPTGDLQRPVVTMHGILDPIQPVSNDAVLRALADAAGNGDKLVQVYVNTWHASFSAEQFLFTLAAMEHWLDSGDRPDASFFPESMGFDNSFVPPPWLY